MKTRLPFIVLCGVLIVPAATTQSQTAPDGRIEFEVATIRPDNSGNGYSGGCHGVDSRKGGVSGLPVPLGRCLITSARLSHLIAMAYDIRLENLKGGPGWVWGVDRFDIEAKAENPSTTTYPQLLTMLQNLLVDRFALGFHHETRQVPGHALVVAKDGPKLKQATGTGTGSVKVSGAAIFKPDAIERKNLDENAIIGQRASMARLADALGNLPDGGPVLDKTGLDGLYDFKLTWEPGESTSSVLQEQLGLKLEPEKISIEFMILDSAQRPAEN